ncbi:hypothetical protein MP638_006326 [Amoeboaphelidium occidentale]|nr:hypothetical protein MP638_006326 [Amoeboaphelidium occidentale]
MAFIVITILLTVDIEVASSVMRHDIWERIIFSPDSPYEQSTAGNNTQVCIVAIDSRHDQLSQSILRQKSIEDLKKFTSTNEDRMSYMHFSIVLNHAYALKHGYRMIMSNTSEYNNVLNETGLPAVWLKPKYLLDLHEQKEEYGDCEWFAMLDSDAFFWMQEHEMSLDQFFSTAAVHETSVNYQERETERLRRGGYFPWSEQSEYFMAGMNGVIAAGDYEKGFPSKFGDFGNDFLCAGVFFVKNNDQGAQLLKDWWLGPEQRDEWTKVRWDWSHKYFSYEQMALNSVVSPKHINGTSVFSFYDFNYKDSNAIRHVWSHWNTERIPRMKHSLKTLGFDIRE